MVRWETKGQGREGKSAPAGDGSGPLEVWCLNGAGKETFMQGWGGGNNDFVQETDQMKSTK